jgi:hypothetical protein
MEIGTKLLKGKYYCFATIDGYDYSFNSEMLDDAKNQMIQLVDKKLGIIGVAGLKWLPLKVVPKNTKSKDEKSSIRYANLRIDNNPIA